MTDTGCAQVTAEYIRDILAENAALREDRKLLAEASSLLRAFWNNNGPALGGEQTPNLLQAVDLHQRIAKRLAE